MTRSRTYLFVPATRLDRVERAWASGCDAVIVDLEDAVADADKATARTALAGQAFDRALHVRINARTTPFHDDDLRVVTAVPTLAGVVVPMVESPDDVTSVARRLPDDVEVIALVETPLGLRRIDDILASPDLSRVAFGSTDYCAALGVERSASVLGHPRSVLAVAAAAAGHPAPIDGPFLTLDDDAGLRDDVVAARALGLRSKLCVHPRQVAIVSDLLRPSNDDVDRARALLAAAEESGGGVFRWQGTMVDEPVLAAARDILTDAASVDEGR
ncbi:MAG: CoA ester lyase [Acidimicrobiales bacterium]